MALLGYLGTLTAAAIMVASGISDVLGPAPAVEKGSSAGATRPSAAMSVPAVLEPASAARTAEWGPRVVLVPGWNEKAALAAPKTPASAVAHAAIKRDAVSRRAAIARASVSPHAATAQASITKNNDRRRLARNQPKLPDIITRQDDAEQRPAVQLSYAPAPEDRFRAW
jgi:hypothetical protein